MILISHRGNLNGRIPERENKSDYIEEAIGKGFDVEVDVWREHEQLWLGHDLPNEKTSIDFLNNEHLWVHAKNIDALEELIELGVHCFFHQNDDVVLTSRGFLWVYPGKKLVPSSICVLPELFNQWPSNCSGICSDFIETYNRLEVDNLF